MGAVAGCLVNAAAAFAGTRTFGHYEGKSRVMSTTQQAPSGGNLGTVRDVVQFIAGTGVKSAVNHLTCNAYGKITAQSNHNDQLHFALTGREWDAVAGLCFLPRPLERGGDPVARPSDRLSACRQINQGA